MELTLYLAFAIVKTAVDKFRGLPLSGICTYLRNFSTPIFAAIAAKIRIQ
ncbi:hypothetical protein [Nostoc sp.]